MQTATQRRVLLILLLSLVPVIAGIVAAIVVRQPAGAAYDACLSALGAEDLKNPGLDALISDLRRAPDYAKVKFNVNKGYQKGAVNILIPGEATRWPAACQLAAEPADCVTSARDGYIVCNPAVGKEVASPLLTSGVANVQTLFALRFLTLTILGHELGHLKFGSSGGKHLLPSTSDAAMNCWKPGPSEETEEQRADAFGATIACQAVRNKPELELLPTDPGGLLRLQSSLENALDWEYFQMDDACVGDKNYPSISRRKHTFAKTYLACLYPGQPNNPVAILANKDAATFDDLERRLRARQVFGVVSSGAFGESTLYSEGVVQDGRGGYLSFDSSGTESTLWRVARRANGHWQLRKISQWPSPGYLVGARRSGTQAQLWFTFDSEQYRTGRGLIRVQVNCPESGEGSCTTTSAQVEIPSDGRVTIGKRGGALLQSSTEAVFVKDVEALLSRDATAGPHLAKPGAPDNFVTAVDSDRGILIPAAQGGIFQTIVFEPTTLFQRQTMVTGDPDDHIESMSLGDGRWYFVVSRRPQIGAGSLTLWNCPVSLLRNSKTTETNECIVRPAPIEPDQSPALASRDLSSLFEKRVDAETCPGIVAVQTLGWLWLMHAKDGKQDVLPASGLIACGDGYVDTFRARRIDRQSVQFSAGQEERKTVISLPVM